MIEHLRAIWKFRHFLFALVRLDLRQRYKRSMIGIGWSLLQPIAMAIVLVFVFTNLLDADPKTYTKTLLLGMAVWGFCRESAVTGCQAFIAHESYIRQSPLPFALYPLRQILGQAIHSSIALGVAIVAVVMVDGPASLEMLWAVIPVLILLVMAGWAIATIFAFTNVYFQDTQHLLEVGTQILFFLTPIIYSSKQGLQWFHRINPVNMFMEMIRRPLAEGDLPPAKVYLYAMLFTVALIALAALVISRCQKRVIFHL